MVSASSSANSFFIASPSFFVFALGHHNSG